MENAVICKPLPLQTFKFPQTLCLLVLAPHPDDFDAIAVTMRFFQHNGNPLHVLVATSGAKGVEDSFCSTPTPHLKSEIREGEQKASCRFFGLAESNLKFLRLEEDKNGQLVESETNLQRIHEQFRNLKPKIVFLPHWNDTNLTHQKVYTLFQRLTRAAGYSLVAFLNRDPKTVRMRYDVYLEFGEKQAAWKAELLRFHRSQQQRNLNQRGHGMDERILRTDRQSAKGCTLKMPYAEVFELEFFGVKKLEDIFNASI